MEPQYPDVPRVSQPPPPPVPPVPPALQQQYSNSTNYPMTQPENYPQRNLPPVPSQETNVTPQNNNDEQYSFLFLILGFFCGVCWILGYVLYKDSPSEQARKYAKYNLYVLLTCFGISCCLCTLGFGIWILVAIINAIVYL